MSVPEAICKVAKVCRKQWKVMCLVIPAAAIQSFRYTGQRLCVGRTAPRHIEVAVSVPEVCLPELSGNSLAVGSVAAVVRLGSAYVAGLEFNSGFHNP